MLATDANGLPLGMLTMSAGVGEVWMAEAILATIAVPQQKGKPKPRPRQLIADKGYDSRKLRQALHQRGIRPCIPPRAGKRGRTPSDHRPILAGLFWMMRTGVGWREIMPQFGPWHTAYSRYQQWYRDGTWQRIVAALPPALDGDQLSL